MADVRRAYRAWLCRRLSWLLPSFLLACAVFASLAADPVLPTWVRFPSLALTAVVAGSILAVVVRTVRVVAERLQGKRRRAQLLRVELRISPGVGVALLVLLLGLLGVPSLFTGVPSFPAPAVRRPPLASVAAVAPAPAQPLKADPGTGPGPSAAPADPAPVPTPEPPAPPRPAPPPQIVLEIARPPEPALRLEDLETAVRPLIQDDPVPGTDPFDLRHRPGTDEDVLSMISPGRRLFSRTGLPGEGDLETWIPPEVKAAFMIVSRSGPWYGSALELEFDLPIGRDDSVRLSYTAMMLTDDREFDGVEPSLTWHRGSVQYVRRLAGYTRESTFDLAVWIGVSVDRLSTHESQVAFDPSMRVSPWIGTESALWQDDRVGLVLQAGFSPGTALTGAASRVADLRVFVRIDLGERSSLELGYRVVSVLFREPHGHSEEPTDRMDRSFMGPIFGLALRF